MLNPLLFEDIAHMESLKHSVFVLVCAFAFVFLHCHQMIGFQKIYDFEWS